MVIKWSLNRHLGIAFHINGTIKEQFIIYYLIFASFFNDYKGQLTVLIANSYSLYVSLSYLTI